MTTRVKVEVVLVDRVVMEVMVLAGWDSVDIMTDVAVTTAGVMLTVVPG